MIAIIDYGMGNLNSVYHALTYIGCECVITDDKELIRKCNGILLPGVGSFKDCMDNLAKHNLIDFLIDEANSGKPFLGICLGMQVLFEKGYEVEERNGLGLLKGEIVKMVDDKVKIPHIGWNLLEGNHALINDIDNPFVYYVHSYYAQNYDEKDIVAISSYGSLKIPGFVKKDNVMGTQFHPEKSGEVGLAILRKFKEMVE